MTHDVYTDVKNIDVYHMLSLAAREGFFERFNMTPTDYLRNPRWLNQLLSDINAGIVKELSDSLPPINTQE